MGKNYIFSSESVGEGHPDKVSDTISDAVLDACLAQDRRSRVACETLVKSNVVCVGGEITTKAKFDIDQVVRDAIRGIGYVNDDDVFHADSVFINNYLTAQSPDIWFGLHITLRFTSPHAAIVSINESLISRMVVLRFFLMMPCNWNAWRVVSLSAPLA